MKKALLRLSFLFICLGSYAQSRYISETTKKVVFARDAGACQCCGTSENLEYDHIMPFSCGGGTATMMITTATCNGLIIWFKL